jgi:hypothetical protein
VLHFGLTLIMKESGNISAPASSFSDLAAGPAYRFSEWPKPNKVPTFGAGVYTIWHHDSRFIYVGMSGRGMTADTVHRGKPLGIYTRLKSHASGRRSVKTTSRFQVTPEQL